MADKQTRIDWRSTGERRRHRRFKAKKGAMALVGDKCGRVLDLNEKV